MDNHSLQHISIHAAARSLLAGLVLSQPRGGATRSAGMRQR